MNRPGLYWARWAALAILVLIQGPLALLALNASTQLGLLAGMVVATTAVMFMLDVARAGDDR